MEALRVFRSQDNPRNFKSVGYRYQDLGRRRREGEAGEGARGQRSMKCFYSISQCSPEKQNQQDMDVYVYVHVHVYVNLERDLL